MCSLSFQGSIDRIHPEKGQGGIQGVSQAGFVLPSTEAAATRSPDVRLARLVIDTALPGGLQAGPIDGFHDDNGSPGARGAADELARGASKSASSVHETVVAAVDPRELAHAEAVHRIMEETEYGRKPMSEAHVETLTAINREFRLERETFERIQGYAHSVAEKILTDPRFIEHARNWPGYDLLQRNRAALEVWPQIEETLGLGGLVAFEPFVLSPSAASAIHGEYNPGTQTVRVNLHRDIHASFAEMISTLLHEGVHGVFDRDTAHIPFDTAIDALKSGEISYEQFMIRTDLLTYLAPPAVDLHDYSLGPHEQAAHSSEEFLARYLIAQGYDIAPRLPDDNLLHQHLRELNLITVPPEGV
ncbi:MAG: hypothetical protein JJU21_14160 [Salinarimonas sp.]|nr:hypothetical protein [Salinarimonas sp.]